MSDRETHSKVPSSPASEPGARYFPCTLTQERFWFLEQLSPGNAALNVAIRWRVLGRISQEALRAGLDALVARYEVLRTAIVDLDGEPRQCVHTGTAAKLSVVDLTRLPLEQARRDVEVITKSDATPLFDLLRPPLMRAMHVRLGPEESVLQLTFHHLVVDGWSIGILARDLMTLTEAAEKGLPSNLPDVELQYVDYALWQREFLRSEAYARERDYWERQLADLCRFDLPTDKPRPLEATSNGVALSLRLPTLLADAMQGLAARTGSTFFVVAAASLVAMLYRAMEAEEIVIGTQIGGRHLPELQDCVGPLINTVVLRVGVGPDMRFSELVDLCHETTSAAIDHQFMPFEAVVEMLNPPRDMSRTPLYSINLLVEPKFAEVEQSSPLRFEPMPSHCTGTMWDLNFLVTEFSDGWFLSCEINTDLFTRESGERFLAAWRAVIEAVTAPGAAPRLSELPAVRGRRDAAVRDSTVGKAPERPLPGNDNLLGIPMHELLIGIWSELLGRTDVRADSHFFEIGGHSLLAVRMISRLRAALNRNIAIGDLFRNPRLGDFACFLMGLQGGQNSRLDSVVHVQTGTLAPIVVINNAWDLFPLARAFDPDRPIASIQFVDRGLEAPLPGPRFSQLVDEAVEMVRQAYPHGPYILLGHCVLGAVALETARVLKRQGEEVLLVALLDTEPPARYRQIKWARYLVNRMIVHVRRARWYFGELFLRRVNLAWVIGRYSPARRLGVTRLLSWLGLKEKWYIEDFHTQHIVDSWNAQAVEPYNGDVVLYRPKPEKRVGFIDRWFAPEAIWKSIVRRRLRVVAIDTEHSAMFHTPSSQVIAADLEAALSALQAQNTDPGSRL